MVPVQIADGHQRKRWAAGSLRGLEYLLLFTGEGVEVDDRRVWFGARKNRYAFAAYCKGVHTWSHPLPAWSIDILQNTSVYMPIVL